MNEWTYSEWKEVANSEELAAFYLYTPLCGTCAVASKILNVVTELKPDVSIGKANLNYVEELATEYQVESVPCLLIKRKGKSLEKVYAFQSVQNILEKLS
ncbi:MPT46 [Lysinibacillus sphaericus]|nr:MPT46 [Lysinibacillus sphaericus]